jgi:DNA-binding IclR family transcriptional regulator
MTDVTLRVLGMFDQLQKETLDLHELFEAGGNDPEARTEVFHAVENLVEAGLLEERGNDFYALTEEGRKQAPRATDVQPEGN